MTDVHTPEQRRRNMSAIRSKNTRPEMLIRRGLHARGYRYSLHSRKLAGHPDIVLKRHHVVIFVHGCFWHGHQCALFRWPSNRGEFWRAKILRNRDVDSRAHSELLSTGWRIVTVWECALRGREKRPLDVVLDQIQSFLETNRTHLQIEGQV